MKREFTIPVTVTAFTKEEAQSQVNLLLQMGAFLKDFNVQNIAGSFAQHFLLAKLSQYTQGRVDMSRYYSPSGTERNPPPEKLFIKKHRHKSSPE